MRNPTPSKRLLLTTVVAALAAGATPAGAQGLASAVGAEESSFDAFAGLLNEETRSSSNPPPTCGDDGHCNFTACPAVNCPDGAYPKCECTAATGECSEDHSIWPGGDDTHVRYSCSCACSSKPDDTKPACTVYDPTTGECLAKAQRPPTAVEPSLTLT